MSDSVWHQLIRSSKSLLLAAFVAATLGGAPSVVQAATRPALSADTLAAAFASMDPTERAVRLASLAKSAVMVSYARTFQAVGPDGAPVGQPISQTFGPTGVTGTAVNRCHLTWA